MRYLSLLLIVFLMSVTWAYVKAPLTIPETTHIDIQDDIKNMISQTISKALPQVAGFRFDRFWTQSLAKNKLKAVFSFSFENAAETEARARYGIEGSAILNYDEVNSVWNVEGPYFSNNEVTFKDGILIRPGTEDGE